PFPPGPAGAPGGSGRPAPRRGPRAGTSAEYASAPYPLSSLSLRLPPASGPHPVTPSFRVLTLCLPLASGPHPLTPSPFGRGGTACGSRGAAAFCSLARGSGSGRGSRARHYRNDGSTPARPTGAQVRPRASAAPRRDPDGALRVVAAAEPRRTQPKVPTPARATWFYR